MSPGDSGTYRGGKHPKKCEALQLLNDLGPIAVLNQGPRDDGNVNYELFSVSELEYLARQLGL